MRQTNSANSTAFCILHKFVQVCWRFAAPHRKGVPAFSFKSDQFPAWIFRTRIAGVKSSGQVRNYFKKAPSDNPELNNLAMV
jgi:hypothetical protein